jgi:hypothetical protein
LVFGQVEGGLPWHDTQKNAIENSLHHWAAVHFNVTAWMAPAAARAFLRCEVFWLLHNINEVAHCIRLRHCRVLELAGDGVACFSSSSNWLIRDPKYPI